MSDSERRRRILLNVATRLGALVLIFVGFVLVVDLRSPVSGPVGLMLGIVAFAGAAALPVLYLKTYGMGLWGLAKREQEDYIRRSGRKPVTDEQQRLLSLGAAGDAADGTWNSSLAWGPTWQFMDEESRSRHRAEAGWSPYRLLDLVDPDLLRDSLDAAFRITRPAGVRPALDRVLASDSISARFLSAVSDEHQGPTVVNDLAERSGWPPDRIRSLTEAVDGRPPRLLWAGDVERAVRMIRTCYMTGLLDEPQAWDFLAECQAVANEFYSDFEEYLEHVRLADIARTGNGVASGAVMEILTRCGWPAATVHPHFRPSQRKVGHDAAESSG